MSATPPPRSTAPGSRALSRSARSFRSISSLRPCWRESPPRKTFTPDQPGDFSGASVDLEDARVPGRAGDQLLRIGGSQHRRRAVKTSCARPTSGVNGWASAGSERRIPAAALAAGDLSGSSQAEINTIIGSFRNAWSARPGTGSANGSFGVSVGGEDPVFRQPIGYIGSFTYSYGQEIRSRGVPGPDPEQRGRVPAVQRECGIDRTQQRALGWDPQPQHAARHRKQALLQQHLQ